jgi:CheY-like chemotaxis protein
MNIAAGLRGDGHDVHLESDGVRAVALHAKHPFNAVIADLLMARMTGRELARAIKRLNPATPVILVTAHLQEMTDSPYDLIIRKPLQHSVLRAALDLFCA